MFYSGFTCGVGITLVFLYLRIQSSFCEVIIFNSLTDHQIMSIDDTSADFGRSLPDQGLMAKVVQAEPLFACSPIKHAPRFPSHVSAVALISRNGGCTFEDKVKYATVANFSAAIVFDPNTDTLIPMGGTAKDTIPAVFIGKRDAAVIRKNFLWSPHKNPHVYFILTDEDAFNISDYLLPFAVVLGICFLVMLSIVLYKCLQDHRRTRRHRLPRSALRKLPTKKFVAGDPYETCCICLDDFEVGDKLRILPCDHGYHSKCIDPWLLKTKRICPQCRKKVFPNTPEEGPNSSDEENETENERAPLLNNRNRPRPTRRPANRPAPSHGGVFRGPSTSAASLTVASEGAAAMAAAAAAAVGSIPPMSTSASRDRLISSDTNDDSSSDEENNEGGINSNSQPAAVDNGRNNHSVLVHEVVAAVETHPPPSLPSEEDPSNQQNVRDNEEDEEEEESRQRIGESGDILA